MACSYNRFTGDKLGTSIKMLRNLSGQLLDYLNEKMKKLILLKRFSWIRKIIHLIKAVIWNEPFWVAQFHSNFAPNLLYFRAVIVRR